MASFPSNPTVGDKYLQGATEYVFNSIGCWDVNGTTGFDVVADKADKFGSNLNKFKVADAVNADEAVSKGQLLTEIQAVDGSGSGLDADTVDGVQGALLGIGGDGYAWVDETANRSKDVVYTNTTSKPIMISYCWEGVGTGNYNKLFVDGIEVSRGSANSVHRLSIAGIVPNNNTYEVVSIDTNTDTATTWLELK